MVAVEPSALKSELRKRLLALRNALPNDSRQAASHAACHLLFSSDAVAQAGTIMLFASIGSEMDTSPIYHAAVQRGLRVAYPRVVTGQRRMETAWVDTYDQLAPGVMSIPEPDSSAELAHPGDLDVIVVPGLAFDSLGHRLGYGAGYYDTFLPAAAKALRIGLTYADCVLESLPVESHDERVHQILTEKELYEVPLE